MARIGPDLNNVIGVRATLGLMAIVLCWLVAATDARAEAPPGPPGCPTPIATSHETATPTAIPTDPAVVTSTLEVQGAGAYLTDVDLVTDLVHTFAADLDMTLQSPAGTVVTLSTDNGGVSDNVFTGTTFDDQADPDGQVPYITNAGIVTDNPYANNVTATPLVPEESLAAFIGENPNGTWTITISDDLAGDGGALNGWRLDIQSLPAAPEPIATLHENATPTGIPTGPAVVTSTLEVQGAGAYLTDVDLFTDLVHTFAPDVDMTLQSPAGTVVTLSTDNGGNRNDNVFTGTTFDDQADPDGQVPYITNAGIATDHPYANLVTATPLVPEESLAAFIGENPNGTWTITISDDLADDGGALNSWRLAITTGSCTAAPAQQTAPPPPPPAPAPSAATTPSDTATATAESVSLRLSIARLSAFRPENGSQRPTARCRMTLGPVDSCSVELRADGRVIARGTRAGAKTAGRVRVPLRLTPAGRRLLANRLGGVRASVSATAGTSSAKARTRAILKVERIITPAGSWVPNTAVLTATGRSFAQSLRGRLVAVSSYSCDGHTAALESRRPDNERALAISRRRAQLVCRALRQSGATGKPGLVAHGGTQPIASNSTESGRARNRRVAITVSH